MLTDIWDRQFNAEFERHSWSKISSESSDEIIFDFLNAKNRFCVAQVESITDLQSASQLHRVASKSTTRLLGYN